jgi:hypothetical protein
MTESHELYKTVGGLIEATKNNSMAIEKLTLKVDEAINTISENRGGWKLTMIIGAIIGGLASIAQIIYKVFDWALHLPFPKAGP